MEPIIWGRAVVLILAGLGVGYGLALVSESWNLNPLAAPAVCAFGIAPVAIVLRNLELPNFLVEGGLFEYAAFLGVGFVRAVGPDNALAHRVLLGDWVAGLVNGVTIVVLVVGLGYTATVVVLLGLPSWAVAQRIGRHRVDPQDAAFWKFVGLHSDAGEDRRL